MGALWSSSTLHVRTKLHVISVPVSDELRSLIVQGCSLIVQGSSLIMQGCSLIGQGYSLTVQGPQKKEISASRNTVRNTCIWAYFNPLKPPYHQVVRGLASNALACQWCLRPPIIGPTSTRCLETKNLGTSETHSISETKMAQTGHLQNRIVLHYDTREHFMQDMYIMRVNGKALLLYKQNASTRAASFP